MLGFDLKAWVQSGLVDYVCPSDFFYTDFNMRVEDFVALTEGTKCKVYPTVHPVISKGNDHQVYSPRKLPCRRQEPLRFRRGRNLDLQLPIQLVCTTLPSPKAGICGPVAAGAGLPDGVAG